MAKAEKRMEEQERAGSEQADLQRRLDGDLHGLERAQQQGREHQARRTKVDETRKKQEEASARNAEEARELEEKAQVLIEGIKNMGLHEEFTHQFFVSKAKQINAAFSKGQFKLPTLGNLSLDELTQRIEYGVRVSIYRARRA